MSYAKDQFQTPAPVHLDKKGEKWARESLKKMSLEQKIGQMFMVRALAQFMNVNSPEYIALRDTMRKYHLGGFGLTVRFEDGFLYKNEPLEAATVINQLQKDSEFPLIFAADFEHGLGMRLNGVTDFPQAMAFGATGNVEFARQSGRITAQEARAIGVQWNWFPDVDVNSNPANPIINTRSFGENPKLVGDMAAAYIAGAHEFGMMTTAKHFPGHGSTESDSHVFVPVVKGDAAHLDAIELPPFRAAIQAGVDAVMIAHVLAPALDSNPNRVATLSPAIVTGLLQQKMGFHGLIITDALDMGGLTQSFPQEAARATVESVKAGNDMLLLPFDLDGSYNGLLRAVRSGEISEARIDQSVLKILRAKASVGLNKAKLVDIHAVNEIVAKPASLATAQEIADKAVTLVRDNHRALPLKATAKGTKPPPNPYQPVAETRNNTVLLIFADDSRSDSGRTLDHELRARIPDAQVYYVDPRVAAGMAPPVLAAVQESQVVVAAVYEFPVAGRVVRTQDGAAVNAIAVQESSAALLRQVLRSAAEKTIVVAVGSPYIAAQLPEVQTYMCTFSSGRVSELSAVKAMFGEIPMTGHLPVTIPNIAGPGAKMTGAAQDSSGGPQ
ncbi:MAG: glycoside hydrolase family 3 N-terminal domain-containing protein [Candidatus Korobacteraceae bacterium]